MKNIILFISLFISFFCNAQTFFPFYIETEYENNQSIKFYSITDLSVTKNIVDTFLIDNLHTFDINLKKRIYPSYRKAYYTIHGSEFSCKVYPQINQRLIHELNHGYKARFGKVSKNKQKWSINSSAEVTCYNKVPSEILSIDSTELLLEKDDTIRFAIHHYLNTLVDSFGLKEFNIPIKGYNDFKEVKNIILFKDPQDTPCCDNKKVKYHLNDTIIMVDSNSHSKKLDKSEVSQFKKIMHNEWNRLIPYNLECFAPNNLFILSDSNNNFIGIVKLMSYKNSCGDVFRFTTYKNGKIFTSGFGWFYDCNALKNIIK